MRLGVLAVKRKPYETNDPDSHGPRLHRPSHSRGLEPMARPHRPRACGCQLGRHANDQHFSSPPQARSGLAAMHAPNYWVFNHQSQAVTAVRWVYTAVNSGTASTVSDGAGAVDFKSLEVTGSKNTVLLPGSRVPRGFRARGIFTQKYLSKVDTDSDPYPTNIPYKRGTCGTCTSSLW